MERKWQKKYNRETKWKTTLRRVRIPLITVSGAFLVALVGFPLLLNGMESEALSAGSLPVSAPLATPLPLPTEAQPMAAGQILPEETPLQAPEGASPSASETPAGTPAQTPDLSGYVSLQSGDESPVVAQIQVRLSELYYLDSDEPTETFGSAHEDALKRFQRTNHMKETGVADPLTQQLLFSESAKPYILENGYSGADVQSLQYRLAQLGYYCDKTNG